MFHDISFAFVSFVNAQYPYPQMMQLVLASHRRFSSAPLILYTHTIEPEFFDPHPNVYIIPIDEEHTLPSVYYYKPYVICDALKRGLQAGYYIEADDILTPACDSIQSYLPRITTIPLSPIHPDGCTPPVAQGYIQAVGAKQQTQPYCHGHVLFTAACAPFLEAWFEACLRILGLHWDESVLNCLYWKEGCSDHYLPILDWGYHYFLMSPEERERWETTYPHVGAFATPITIHGAKDLHVIKEILDRLSKNRNLCTQ